jgi:hypothetical protein
VFRAKPCFRRLLLPAVLLTICGLFAGSAIAKLSQYLPKDSATGYTVKALKMGERRDHRVQQLVATVVIEKDTFRVPVLETPVVPERARIKLEGSWASPGLRAPPVPA